MAASVRAYPAGWTGGSSTPISARQGVSRPVEFRGTLVVAACRRCPGQALQAPLQVHQVAGIGEQRCRLGEQGLRPGVVAIGQVDVAFQVSDMAVLHRSPYLRATARLSSSVFRAAARSPRFSSTVPSPPRPRAVLFSSPRSRSSARLPAKKCAARW